MVTKAMNGRTLRTTWSMVRRPALKKMPTTRPITRPNAADKTDKTTFVLDLGGQMPPPEASGLFAQNSCATGSAACNSYAASLAVSHLNVLRLHAGHIDVLGG